MKLIDIINRHYESSSSVTEHYKRAKRDFVKTLQLYFGKESVIVTSCPHFEFTGFIKKLDKFVYFATGDLRYRICNSMLVRTARHEKDYTGGHNQSVSYMDEDFDNSFRIMINKLLDN